MVILLTILGIESQHDPNRPYRTIAHEVASADKRATNTNEIQYDRLQKDGKNDENNHIAQETSAGLSNV